MTPRKLQICLAAIFLILGAWCLLAPSMVVGLTFSSDMNNPAAQARFLMGCFGAQAVLTGVILMTARFTPTTFLVFGIAGSVPFFAFNLWFSLIEPVLNAWMLLDFIGNVGILVAGLWGWRLALRDQQVQSFMSP